MDMSHTCCAVGSAQALPECRSEQYTGIHLSAELAPL